MKYNIALIKGDGIGPEIVSSAVLVLQKVAKKHGFEINFSEVLAGGCATDKYGIPLPEETLNICKQSDSILLGAVGGPKWDTYPVHLRPEKALLGIRKELGLYANIRPVKLFSSLANACPLKDEISSKGIDLVVVRELTGGIYFGKNGRDGESAYDTETYSKTEVERIGRCAFELAMKRSRRLCSIDKANVLESSRLWREVMHSLSKEYKQVEYSDMLIDNAAMQLIRNPSQFDVLVTSNLFGDILSDEASMLTGSIGMLPSASLGKSTLGMYEPIHGSAPDIAGKNIANPIATILSAAMMLDLSLNQSEAAKSIENAVSRVLEKGYRTTDIATKLDKPLTCSEITDMILLEL